MENLALLEKVAEAIEGEDVEDTIEVLVSVILSCSLSYGVPKESIDKFFQHSSNRVYQDLIVPENQSVH